MTVTAPKKLSKSRHVKAKQAKDKSEKPKGNRSSSSPVLWARTENGDYAQVVKSYLLTDEVRLKLLPRIDSEAKL